MLNIFVEANPVPPRTLSLHRIWRVEADADYDNLPTKRTPGSHRIVRTIGGQGEILLQNGRSLLLGEDTVTVLPVSEIRRYRCAEEFWKFWWFECELDDIESTFHMEPVSIPVSAEEIVLQERSWRLLQHPEEERRREASAAVAYLLQHWTVGAGRERVVDEQLALILAEIPFRLQEGWSVTDMARAAGMSERSFRDAFRRVTGRSPRKYVNGIRIRFAREQLATTRLQVQEIAEKLGFSSSFHMSRAFHEAYGMPPTTFRNQVKNKIPTGE